MANSQAAVMRPLGGIARAFAALQGRLYQAPPVNIAGVNANNWPSALQPVQPVGPPGSQPLNWGFWQGLNQNITPRPDAEFNFQQLRMLATYPLARICIENIKDQLSSLKWTFQLKETPGESLKDRRKRQENDTVIPALDEFFAFPDGETPWSDWIRPLIEDLLVIDAPSILIQKTLTGKVIKLRVLDGSEILRLIDDQGYTPAPPSPAYTQLWEGIPRVLLTSDQLLYRPRNIVRRGTVASQLYGYSPTEAMNVEITTGIERLRYVLAFYTEGGVPGMVRMIPPGTSPDKILEAMQWQNSELAGNLAKRRQWRDIQSFSGTPETGPKDTIHEFKEPVLADVYDDLHIRKIAFAYGASAQRLLRMMNRASAQAGQEAAQEEGTIPWVKWLKSTLDVLIQRKMGYPAYEAIPDTSVELDPTKQADIDKTYVSTGQWTINEARDKRGMEALPQPEASQPMIITPTGAIPLDGSIERTQEAHTAAIAPKPAPIIAGPKPTEPNEPETPKKKLAKASEIKVDPDRKTFTLELAKTKMHAQLTHFLYHSARKAADKVAIAKKSRLRKADSPDEDEIDRIVEAIMAEIPWSDVVDLVEPDLTSATVEGGSLGLQDLGLAAGTVTAELPAAEVDAVISAVNAVARDYAKDRAAEMVGKKYVDGELVDNPNAAWRIDEATRNMLRTQLTEAFSGETPMTELTAVIRDAGAFSESRADMIARTEVSNAQMFGNAQAWLKSGLVEEFAWRLSSLHQCCDICDTLAADGPYPVAKVLELLLLKHPNCQCVIYGTKVKGVKL